LKTSIWGLSSEIAVSVLNSKREIATPEL